jgi:hypothetical protein
MPVPGSSPPAALRALPGRRRTNAAEGDRQRDIDRLRLACFGARKKIGKAYIKFRIPTPDSAGSNSTHRVPGTHSGFPLGGDMGSTAILVVECAVVSCTVLGAGVLMLVLHQSFSANVLEREPVHGKPLSHRKSK